MGKLQSIAILLVIARIGALFPQSETWVFADPSDSDAATEAVIIRCWEEAKMDSLRLLQSSFAASHPDSPVTLFLQAALERDGHVAARGYQRIVEIGGDAGVVPRAMHRLIQYYRSLGDYSEASKWEQRLQSEYPAFRVPQYQAQSFRPSDYPYALQLGAFGQMKNARKLSEKAESYGLSSEVERRIVNGRTLYIVLAGQFATEDGAQRAGERLLREEGMTYRVVPRSIPDD